MNQSFLEATRSAGKEISLFYGTGWSITMVVKIPPLNTIPNNTIPGHTLARF
jgi:hypothetical protein